ncbi:MAG: ISL3 family transposase [Chthonomonadaceae bacterium]|nr:MAG: ISL3 family transposase [Chthonomonadaceae bacterium]
MQPTELFALGLGLTPPWKIVDIEFIDGEVHIKVDFERGARFGGLEVHDTSERKWRHLNFFKYPCFIHARVPRVIGKDGKVATVQVPWAHAGSGFTMDFEAHAIELVSQMPVAPAARLLRLSDTRLWRLIHQYVKRTRDALGIGQPTRIGVDETAARRGHDYITVFVDLDARRVLYACQGRSGSALFEFKAFLKAKGADPAKVQAFTCDMGPAFLGGIAQAFPQASVTLDRYHLVALLTRAVDETRKAETKKATKFKRTRWLWLKNPTNLSEKEKLSLQELLEENAFPLTGKAYGLRLAFQELFKVPRCQAQTAFYEWIGMALASDIHAVVEVAVTFFNAADKILRWFETRISNGFLEGLHSVLQAAKNKARGYSNPQNLIAMSYLLHGKLRPATHTKQRGAKTLLSARPL